MGGVPVADVFRDAEYIVVPSGSCTSMVSHHYAELFHKDPGALERVHRVAHQVLDDPPEHHGVGPDPGQLGRDAHLEPHAVGGGGARHLAEQRAEVGRRPVGDRGPAGVASRQLLEIGHARLQGLPPLGVERRELLGMPRGRLGEVPEHVADRRQPVLHVMVDLAGEIAGRGAPLRRTAGSSPWPRSGARPGGSRRP